MMSKVKIINCLDGSFEYNIEPWRADKGYWGFFNSKCN